MFCFFLFQLTNRNKKERIMLTLLNIVLKRHLGQMYRQTHTYSPANII